MCWQAARLSTKIKDKSFCHQLRCDLNRRSPGLEAVAIQRPTSATDGGELTYGGNRDADESKDGRQSGVDEIELIRQHLLDARDMADTLAAGWEVFELVRVLASAAANRAADMYPAFTFARGSAVNGRNAIAFAPSMPTDYAGSRDGMALPMEDVGEVADILAGLASALSVRLREAAGLATAAGDRIACETAARDAGRISELLAESK
jgi:hypothetical protein